MALVKQALELMQRALPGIPMGTEFHTSVLKSVESIGKQAQQFAESPQMKMQIGLGLLQHIRQNQPTAALHAMAGGPPQAPMIGGGAPMAGGAGAAPPPPMAGGAAAPMA